MTPVVLEGTERKTAETVIRAHHYTHMKRRRILTSGKLPERVCPVCDAQVIKTVRHGQLSYECGQHWGPWDKAKRKSCI